jgi:hypothetical protein
MAKSARKATPNVLTMPIPASTAGAGNLAADIAKRAFEIYCERGCQDGHDVEDWLQAERELQEAANSAA